MIEPVDETAVIPASLAQLGALASGGGSADLDPEAARVLGELLTGVAIEGRLTIRAGRAVRDGRCWLGTTGGLIAFANGEDVQQETLARATSVECFAGDLARLLELGPRAGRLPETAICVQRDDLLAVTGASGDVTLERAAGILGLSPGDPVEQLWLEALVSPRAVHWKVSIAPLGMADDPSESRWCEVLDCGAHGMLLLWSSQQEDAAELLLEPADPTAVWRVLSSLLSAEVPEHLLALSAEGVPDAPA